MKIDIEKFKNIPFEKRELCAICNENLGSAVIDMPDFPMTEIYTDKKVAEPVGFVNQSFHFCENCGHGQLANVINPEIQYGDAVSYHFRTSESMSGKKSADFFLEFLKKIIKERHFKSIVEIGCSDLYLLKMLKSKADKLIGIDPILKGRETEFSEDNVRAVGDFFENVILDEGIELVICKDTLEHVSRPRQFVKKIIENGDANALFFFQFPLLETLLEGCRFDQIFHQHLNYFSFKSIMYMLNLFQCELIDYTIDRNHWNAIIIAFKKGTNNPEYLKTVKEIKRAYIIEGYGIFKKSMEVTRKRLALLKNEKIYGYGAALMLPVLSYHLKDDLSFLKCVIDDDKKKQGLYYINLPVSIQTKENIKDIENSVVLVTAIASKNNVYAILSNLRELNPKQVILPINLV